MEPRYSTEEGRSLRQVPDRLEVIRTDLDDTSSLVDARSGRTFDAIADHVSLSLGR